MKMLKDKVAIVTGAGSGIGKAIAGLFAEHGATVILADLKQENIEAVSGEISRRRHKSFCFAADVSKASDVQHLMEYVVRTYGQLDILVNNAGIMDDFLPAGELSEAQWHHVLETNLTGPFLCCRYALPVFISQRTGNIINIASIGGLFGGRAGAAYTASKHGMIGLTRNIGYQYGPSGIRCNAIAPGGVMTNILTNAHPNPFGYDRMKAGTGNMPESCESDDIANIALFLASKQSESINGTVITADDGWTAY